MNANNSRTVRSTFFMRVAQVGHADDRFDRVTLPLFPLALILEADGTLADRAKHIAKKVRA